MKKNIFPKVKAGFTLMVLVLAFFVTNIKPASAIPTEVILSIPEAQRTILQKIQVYADKAWKTYGAKLVGTTVRNTLNRVALDAAKYVGSAGEGQKPTYVVEDLGSYWKNLGDAAAGDFIDGLSKTWGVDLCQPPDANIQAKVGLALVQTMAPAAPNCTLTNLVSNYSTAFEKFEAMENGDYFKALNVNFSTNANELGGALTLFGRKAELSTKAAEDAKNKSLVTEGWLDVRNIAGKLTGTPGASKDELKIARETNANNLLFTTGDALVDASNTFLNQLAYESFQRVLRELNKKGNNTASEPLNTDKLSDGFEKLVQYGESVISEKLASVIKPRFDVRSDYSILSDLASCANINNPGPTNCVIDDKFSQAISEKLTVGEALDKGYLHGDWLVSNNNKSESTYTLRSASILRKYRILPVGWEQAISVAAEKKYRVTLQDLISCFDGTGLFSNDFDKNNQAWCRGLVDPNWVLKAPLNFCGKQGNGNQILSSLISQDAFGSSTLAVSRATDYCADDQTCIKEKADGSCEVYGYCNEEKRTWKFGSDSCEPVYNTCQTFTSISDKQTASFLENTLDYSTCDSNNSGCKQYSYKGAYASSTNNISWDKNYSIFFNNKAVTCDSSSEACTKLLRGKPGWIDVNYIMDADFSLNNIGDTSASSTSWHWPVVNGVGSIIYDEGKALFIDGHSGAALSSDNNNNVLPKNLAPISGWSYTLSAEIKVNSGNNVTMTLGSNGDKAETSATSWTLVSVTTSNTNSLDFKISGSGAKNLSSFSIKNLKLTPNNYYAGYSNYAAFPIYEKLLPTYLEQSCYNSVSGTGDYTLKNNAPATCSNFARKCNRNEVGCELFTSAKDIFAVAAKANVNDYCDASCVGYDTYLAKESYFYGTSADNLIPDKTNSCNAESAGCASFTNLDSTTAGGESVEYYAKVRQCIKPDTASCSDFYSWDNAQLKVMSLKKDSSGDPFAVNSALDAACTKDTYNLPVTDPKYNPDCREFYTKSGKITYHLISNTVSCSDDCRSYRLNEKNIDKNLNAGSCVDVTGVDRTWDTAQNACYVCQNGGTWDTNQNACVYKVIPSEGTTCAAEEVGCREYNGNNGNSLKLSAAYDFENGVDGFYALNGGFVVQGLESTAKNGHSLNIAGNVAVGASSFAKKDSAYIAKFMAKASSAVIANLSFENSKEVSVFNVDDKNPQGNINIKGDSQWHLYEVNLNKIDHETAAEYLKIKVNGNLTIDNLIINEVTDRYYLIQGSSNVPSVCFYDMADVYQGPNYNLGCAAYTDRAGTTHNLHQFSELCQNSAVGCEQMIQTNNSANYYGYNVNLNNDDRTVACAAGTPGCIEVKDAEAIYAVFDLSKQCNKADAGCSRFGYLKTVANTSTWVDVFKKNLPDAYNNETSSPLCQSSEVGCDTWTYGNGSASYFKTPGLNTCIFKNNYWYKSPVKRCDTSGAGDGKITDNEKVGPVCLSDSDCGTKKCITDTNDYPCSTTYLKTVGLGGINGRVATPDGAVGLCNVASAGCGEYIDPVSKYVNNLIYNPAAQEIDGVAADKWTKEDANYYTQKISVKPNKLYILQVDGDVLSPVFLDKFSTVDNGSGGTVRILGADNKLGDLVSRVTSTSSIMFNTGANIYLNVYRPGISTATINAANISIKEAVVNYQLSENIDTTTCNGIVNTDNGCVLFNARTQAGRSGLKRNIFNATLTNEGSAPYACKSTDASCLNNANSVIKVSPDRTCSRWLSCQTYTEDPITFERTCYKMGECDQLNEKNECGNFLPLNEINRDIKNSQNKNATGYSLLNNWYIGGMKEVGQNTDAHFDFEDNSVTLNCITSSTKQACTAEKLIITPDKIQNEALADYPAHGKGYIKVLNSTQVSPDNILPAYVNQDYYINYLVNTKGSSAKARVLIIDSKTGDVKATFTDSANNGWERKVYKFNIASSGTKNTQVPLRISLTSDTTSATVGYVFFDDIRVEPVLQTGVNSYAARDCRLYPSDDSTSCLSVNNNVIKDGLYGYCLQYDPLNPGVCLMWYPVDKISSISKSDQVNLGYSGKFPLYYCTEANGDFNLAKKIIASSNSYSCEGCNNLKEKTSACGNVTDNNNPKDSGPIIGRCGSVVDPNYITIRVSEGYKGAIWPLAGTPSKTKELCIPNPAKLLIKSKEVVVDALKGDLYGKTCGYPNDSDAKITYYEGWTIYNGSFQKITTHNIDESANATSTSFDSIMVLDNGKSLESDLRFISSTNLDKNYQIGCNKFTQLINNTGDDMAWAERVSKSSVFASTTPNFFSGNLLKYGRDNEDVPFGAAVLPSDYDLKTNSSLITLRNQYSAKNQETLFAGRPYGCSGASCNMIGQCSLNPNIYCIYSASDANLNSKGCSFGACQQLWTSVPTSASALINLNNIFVKRYADYTYSSGAYIGENINAYTQPGRCLSTRTPGTICAYLPTISNTQLKSGGVALPITGNNVAINYGGLYQLEFDVYVDAEQQPLKQIQVYWGKEDGTQVVTNFDNTVKEDASGKKYYHISLTHYYLRGDKHLEIRIMDNWDTYKCSSMVGGRWSDSCSAL